jgi:cytochrome b
MSTIESPQGTKPIPVWDRLIRVLHWTLAGAFLTSWLTAEELMQPHMAAGFTILAIIAIRTFWGLTGPGHARFAGFVPTPGALFSYLGDLVRGRAARYVGHNPAGGAMIVALLAGLLFTAASGVALKYGVPGLPLPHHQVEELHEAAATGTLILVCLHIAGVLLSSLLHRENLVRSMLTGRKYPS